SPRRKTSRRPGTGAHQIRNGRQSEDRARARPDRSADPVGAGQRGHRMRRRNLILGVAGAAIVRPVFARAQQTSLPVVGFISSLSYSAPFATAFRRGLAEMGYVDGRDVAIEGRWIVDSYDALPAMGADLVQ